MGNFDTELHDLLIGSPDWLAPSQYVDQLASPQSRLSCEQRLVIFVLRDCITEYQESSRGKAAKLSALRWLAEHEAPAKADYFSFPYCCEVLGRDPDTVREAMVKACETLTLQALALRMTRRQTLQPKRVRRRQRIRA